MFFSVISFYTKLNKKNALNYSETKNFVKKTKVKNSSVFFAVSCEN
jgi:hypothetical protein